MSGGPSPGLQSPARPVTPWPTPAECWNWTGTTWPITGPRDALFRFSEKMTAWMKGLRAELDGRRRDHPCRGLSVHPGRRHRRGRRDLLPGRLLRVHPPPGRGGRAEGGAPPGPHGTAEGRTHPNIHRHPGQPHPAGAGAGVLKIAKSPEQAADVRLSRGLGCFICVNFQGTACKVGISC